MSVLQGSAFSNEFIHRYREACTAEELAPHTTSHHQR